MEDSFFEYRDKNDVQSESDSEFIDNSLVVENVPLSAKKKNVFIPESEESTDDENEADISKNARTVPDACVITSSDEEEVSPELLPKRRPPIRKKSINPDESLIGRKTKKRMVLLDSDTDNSIVNEQDSNNKLTCLKDTPIKIDSNAKGNKDVHDSMEYESHDDDDKTADSATDEDDNASDSYGPDEVENSSDSGSDENEDASDSGSDENDDAKASNDADGDGSMSDKKLNIRRKDDKSKSGTKQVSNDEIKASDDDDGPDEDLLVMSRATRMSIMGVLPKDGETDDSDFIESDNESSHKSKDSIANSVPDVVDADLTVHKTPEKTDQDANFSNISCSPFTSPLKDLTNVLNKSSSEDKPHVIDLSNVDYIPMQNKVSNKNDGMNKENSYDVAIIDKSLEVIALSSDDEDYEVKPVKTTIKEEGGGSSAGAGTEPPPSSFNQLVYVKKSVKDNELDKLQRLREDLRNLRKLLDEIELAPLPDGGSALVARLSALEDSVRRQGDRVANMLVQPDSPTAQDIAKEGPSWEDIQLASNAVQPKLNSEQAMATHMAQRNLILDSLRDLHKSLASRPAETELAVSPRIISSELMPHQLHALAWLKWRETQKPSAGILADDMGLGKTITMIALVASDKEGKIDHDDDAGEERDSANKKLTRGGTLVVCPASLVQQWAGEVQKHCRAYAVSVCLHHGAARATHAHRLAAYDMVATTYNILQRDSEKNGVLMRVAWRRVILDEAHIVRNHKSATSGAVCALHARRRWCLTGTPVHNKDLDLFALLKFLRCYPFDSLKLWKIWLDDKSQGGQERLSTLMRCILLRRTKAQLQQRGQLACLPARTAHHTAVTLTQHEMNVYQKVLVLSKSLFAQFLHQRAEKNSETTSFSSRQQDSEYFKMHKRMMALQGVKPVKSHEILVLLLRLRQVCCHCGLIAAMLDEETASQPPDPASEDLLHELDKLSLDEASSRRKSGDHGEEKEDEEPQELATVTEAIRAVLAPNNPVFELTRPSSKIQAVMDCLNTNVFSDTGDKAVVVSQWTSVLRLVEAELNKRRVRSVTLSGKVPVPARQQIITTFNDPHNDVKIMLLSLCAGGVGINLCGGNHLLLLDPHWNPQLEEQAQDRIYRVGQMKHVHIYRFMCEGTVEQTIRKLQESKLKLAENVLTGARNNTASTLSIEDLKLLFNMGR